MVQWLYLRGGGGDWYIPTKINNNNNKQTKNKQITNQKPKQPTVWRRKGIFLVIDVKEGSVGGAEELGWTIYASLL